MQSKWVSCTKCTTIQPPLNTDFLGNASWHISRSNAYFLTAFILNFIEIFLLAPNSEYGLWNSSGFVKDSLLMTDDGFLGHTSALNSRFILVTMAFKDGVKAIKNYIFTVTRGADDYGVFFMFSCSTIPFQRCDQPFFKFRIREFDCWLSNVCFCFKCLVLSIRIGIKI